MSLTNHLKRFKQHIIRDSEVSNRESKINGFNYPHDYEDVWKEAGVVTYKDEEAVCFIREKRYPLNYVHGNYSFSDFLTAVRLWDQFEGSHPLSAKGMDPSDLFFFDTETTGLYGGAGNTIFLLGHARVIDHEVIVRQHFLPEPGFEVPLYKSFLESVDYTTLVTYNGKAFDWPQVKTRHTFVKEHVPKLPEFGHFDLYHAARRLWKNRLESVKLVNVEKHILGVTRKDDVPGYLAPMIYFDYVERKNPEAILKVMRHNELDVLSLLTLYTHLTFQIHCLDPRQTAEEKVFIGKWFHALGEREVAASTFELATNKKEITAEHELAYYYKRKKDYDGAKQLWKTVTQGKDQRLRKEAFIELAKLMEHQYKDYEKAITYTEKAMMIYEQMNNGYADQADPFILAGNKRRKRLQNKWRKCQSFPGQAQ